jgi:chromosome segregation ATPase
MITAEGMMSSAQPSSSIQTIAGLKEAENEKKLEEKEKILHLMQKQEQQLHSEIKSMKVELEALQTQYDKKCKEVEVKSNALFEINEKFTKKQQEFELELQKIRDEWKKSDEKILDAKRNALAMQKDQQNTLDENLMLRKSLEEIVQKLEETIRTSQITEETFEKEKNHLIEKLNQVENQLSNVLHVDQLISTKMKEW